MPDRPELPEQFRSSWGLVSLLPDVRPMRWSIWNLDGCLGEISLTDGIWHSHPEPQGTDDSTFSSWQDAVDAIVSG